MILNVLKWGLVFAIFLTLQLDRSVAQDNSTEKGGDAENYVTDDDIIAGTQITWGVSKTEFMPQKDITTYELSLVVKCLIENQNYCSYPPKEVERHFTDRIICTGPEECEKMGYGVSGNLR